MIDQVADIISWLFLGIGSFFLVVGAIGIVRMPDIFTRMHAVSVAETMGVGFLLAGLMVQAGLSLVTFKLFCLFLLIFFTSPVASHAIARAAMADGVEPILDGDELDARGRTIKPLADRRQKITTPIDAGEAETSASTFVESVKENEEDKK